MYLEPSVFIRYARRKCREVLKDRQSRSLKDILTGDKKQKKEETQQEEPDEEEKDSSGISATYV